MNRHLLLVICIVSASWLTAAPPARYHTSNKQFGHSFMFTRPANQHLMIEQALWHAIIYHKRGEYRFAWNLTSLFQQSINDDNIKQYFLFDGKEQLLVAGDNNPMDIVEQRDVRAEWLQLPSDYRGVLTINPRQQQGGISFQIHQDIGNWISFSFLKDSWIDISMPIYVVENDMDLGEKFVFNKSNTQPFSITDAFDQPDMCYGKIAGKRTAIEVAEINVKLGRTYLSKNNAIVAYYSKASFPTAKSQNAEFLFDPFVGNNGHFGFGTGVNFQLQLTRDTDPHIICLFVNLEGTFYIRKHEHRTFDLRGKPWSRYMRLVEANTPVECTIPAVNVFTQEVLVRPYNTVDFSTGLRFKNEHWEIEIGYSIWGRGDETIECPKNFPEGFFGIAGNPDQYIPPNVSGKAVTASMSTIQQRAENDTATVNGVYQQTFVPIFACDLNLNTGSAQSSLNHQLHGAIGWHSNTKCKRIGFIGIGFFYDMPQKNSALKLWGAWLKFGTSM